MQLCFIFPQRRCQSSANWVASCLKNGSARSWAGESWASAANTGPYMFKSLRANIVFGESAPLKYLRHICLMLRGRLQLEASADVAPAGSRLSRVCCNRKGFCDSHEPKAPGQSGVAERPARTAVWFAGQGVLPCGAREVQGAILGRCSVQIVWRYLDSENRGQSGRQGGGAEGEERHRFLFLQTNLVRSFTFSKAHGYQQHMVFCLFVDKIRSHVRFVNCMQRYCHTAHGLLPRALLGGAQGLVLVSSWIWLMTPVNSRVWKQMFQRLSLPFYIFKEH